LLLPSDLVTQPFTQVEAFLMRGPGENIVNCKTHRCKLTNINVVPHIQSCSRKYQCSSTCQCAHEHMAYWG